MMTDSIYYKLVDHYFHQCGCTGRQWLDMTMAAKWEMNAEQGAICNENNLKP